MKIAITDLAQDPCETKVEYLAGWYVINTSTFSCRDVPLLAVVGTGPKKTPELHGSQTNFFNHKGGGSMNFITADDARSSNQGLVRHMMMAHVGY